MSFRVVERDLRHEDTLLVGDGLDHDAAYDLVNALHSDTEPTWGLMLPSETTEPVMFRDLPVRWSR